MKHFLIRYRLTNGAPNEWHQTVAEFISALANDAELKDKIGYRCLKIRDDASYLHFASAADEQSVQTLQQRDYFKRYTEATRLAGGGDVVVSPLELIAETQPLP